LVLGVMVSCAISFLVRVSIAGCPGGRQVG
jgi:hypothetical protein